MSIIGEYFRVTAAELDRAIQDSDWALGHIEESRDVEEEAKPSPAEARHFSTYKAWHLLDFLLQRSGFPVGVIHGEESSARPTIGDTVHRTTCPRTGFVWQPKNWAA